ncbi:exosortase N [Desertivirga brevis]|uniref:exosortase N n=1 Tax=Desertivirga brevis TaxID=2810310 RepID=UPI001A96BAE7|nr:exosortase N [Pedobacter sp. SYSU D00873]
MSAQSIALRSRPFTFPGLVVFCYLAISIFALRRYFIFDAISVCGFLLLPLIARLNQGSSSLRFLPISVLTAALAIFFPVNTCLFLAALFALIFFIETYLGKINLATILTLLIVSPVFKVVMNTFGFPLRLWISGLAAKVINASGIQAIAEGNTLIVNGNSFIVEQACAGLSMLNVSLIICLFLISHWENTMYQRIKNWQVFSLLFVCILLNLIGNLIRILFLVLLKIEPENFLHDLTGIVCLVVYSVFPLMFMVKRLVGSTGVPVINAIPQNNPVRLLHLVHCVLFSVVLYVSLNLNSLDKMNNRATNIQLSGYKREIMDNKIVKFSNNKALLYFKPSAFYAPDHDPKICWKGSGYKFSSVKETNFPNYKVYTGTLIKGKEKLYTAWWYSSDKTQTVNQLEWRWKACVSNEGFYLINATANSEEDLMKLVKELIRRGVDD